MFQCVYHKLQLEKLEKIYDGRAANRAVRDKIRIYETERVLIIEGQYTKDKVSGKITIVSTIPVTKDGENYKIMLWDEYNMPVICAITNQAE